MKRRDRSAFNSRVDVEVDAFGRNPLLDDARQVMPHMASRLASAPTLFATGDLPLVTASGNPPSMLNQLPARLRPGAARASQQRFAELVLDCATEDGAAYALMYAPEANDPGWYEYEQRMRDWLAGR